MESRRILVAGANGVLGGEILRELCDRGLAADALDRDVGRLGTYRSRLGKIHVADARDPFALKGVCEGVGAVISTIGANQQLRFSKDKSTFFDTDYGANKNLLAEALRAHVEKFVYVSLCNGNTTLKGIVFADAHEAFVDELTKSGIDYAVIRPSGFFYLFEEILVQARKGRGILVGDGSARTNPVHEHDVAISCIDALTSGEKEVSIGGPDILTRKEIAEMGFEILGKPATIRTIPAGLLRAAILPLRFLDRRLYDVVNFSIGAFAHEIVAPRIGTHRLRDYLVERAETR
jgi:uncharacterized protein YbjT (DUF2867 family)